MSTVEQPTLSVIIPVYRTEAYLGLCLTSVARQELQNLEVIVVNDGSPDGSQAVIDEYASMFDRFECIQTVNKGQSAARNTGLERARGRYVCFLDSDDYVPPEAYRTLVRAAERSEVEICVGVAQSFRATSRWVNPQMTELVDCVMSHGSIDDYLPLVHDASPWNKVFSRQLIEREKLRFPVGINLREDLHFVLRAFIAARGIAVIPSIVYYYRVRGAPTNVSRTEEVHAKVFDDLIWVSNDLCRTLEGRISSSVQRELFALFLRYIAFRLPRYMSAYPTEEQKTTLDNLRLYLNTIPEDLMRAVLNPVDRKLLCHVAAGSYDAARIHVHAARPRRTSRLNRLRPTQLARRVLAGRRVRIKKRIARIPITALGTAEREVKLAVARTTATLRNKSEKVREVWMVGERRGMSAQDTGFAFFDYLRKNHPEIDAYFVTKASIPRTLSGRHRGHILDYGSTASYDILLNTDVVAYSDSGKDLCPNWQRVAGYLPKHTVGCFLQHGVIGLSGMGEFYLKERVVGRRERLDVFATSSEAEKEVVLNNLGYERNEVVVTGLSRFDTLFDNRTSAKEILYMPSWRSWLRNADKETFERSEYFLSLQAVLGDHRLHKLLTEHDYRLVFFPHFAMQSHLGSYRSCGQHIRTAKPDERLQDYVKRAQLLITDYSSVSYDFAYQKKPILFYQFDTARFYSDRGQMLIDPVTDMMGDIVRTHKELLASIRQFLESDHTMKRLYEERSARFFAHYDNQNCARIYSAIQEKRAVKGVG